jgi:hypothetical protein
MNSKYMISVYNSMVRPAYLFSIAVSFYVSHFIATDSTRFFSHVRSVVWDNSEIKFNDVRLSFLVSRQEGLDGGESRAVRPRSSPIL